ncbi:hypothetical protein BG22_06145 [Bifidobacterium sp. UTBIF-78]|nr:hypothetical protein BG22_06145 [Bifidobacterium sp. UTBIF-78]
MFKSLGDSILGRLYIRNWVAKPACWPTFLGIQTVHGALHGVYGALHIVIGLGVNRTAGEFLNQIVIRILLIGFWLTKRFMLLPIGFNNSIYVGRRIQ